MTKKRLFYCLIFLLIFSSACTRDNVSDFPELKGPYLGQKPPGEIPEIFAPGIISTNNTEWAPTFTPDGTECCYTIGAPENVNRLVYMKSINGIWQPPELAPFSGPHHDADPFISPDGKRLFFWSNRPDSISGEPKNNSDIWFAERDEDTFGQPQRVDSIINTDSWQIYPTVSSAGNLYFSGYYGDNTKGGFDIYTSSLVNREYTKPVNLGDSVNTAHLEQEPFIAPDESYILFCSNRHEPKSQNWDIYISFRKADGSWTKAKNAGEVINSPVMDLTPSVTSDGRYFFFSSLRSRTVDYTNKNMTYKALKEIMNGPMNGSADVYWADAKIIENLKPEELK